MTAYTASPTDTVGITDIVAGRIVFSRSFTDAVGITDTLARRLVFSRARTDTVGITDILSHRLRFVRNLTDTVGITEVLTLRTFATFTNSVGIIDTLAISGVFIPYDTWRPVPKPDDNNIVLVCRTPQGTHDTYAGLTQMTMWTLRPDGTNERQEILDPGSNGFGWLTFSHPEWSPDGDTIVMVVETSAEYKLVLLNSSAFGL